MLVDTFQVWSANRQQPMHCRLDPHTRPLWSHRKAPVGNAGHEGQTLKKSGLQSRSSWIFQNYAGSKSAWQTERSACRWTWKRKCKVDTQYTNHSSWIRRRESGKSVHPLSLSSACYLYDLQRTPKYYNLFNNLTPITFICIRSHSRYQLFQQTLFRMHGLPC